MNIKQALDRLNAIEEAQGQASILSTLLCQAPKGVHVQVYGAEGDRHSSANGRYCVIDADLLQTAIEQTEERYAAEAAKLQPVIDMAEAALKGILTTGDTK